MQQPEITTYYKPDNSTTDDNTYISSIRNYVKSWYGYLTNYTSSEKQQKQTQMTDYYEYVINEV